MTKVSSQKKIKDALLLELEKAIEKTVNDNCSLITLPWIGDKTFSFMANSALNVLLAMADHEKYMEDNGLVSE